MLLKMKTNYRCCVVFFCLSLLAGQVIAQTHGETILFTGDWKFHKGDVSDGEKKSLDDHRWRSVELPHDWSIEGPFNKEWASGTGFLPGGIGWYRKAFLIDKLSVAKKVFINSVK
jgi:beta-galactosidase